MFVSVKEIFLTILAKGFLLNFKLSYSKQLAPNKFLIKDIHIKSYS
jgi:hypothetical protein